MACGLPGRGGSCSQTLPTYSIFQELINDYSIEGTGAKSTAMVNLVKSLKAAGVPIDDIGVQAHLIANLEQFTALGVEVAITEMDIRMALPSTVTDALLAQQKKVYQIVIAACKTVAGCIGVTIWDYTYKLFKEYPPDPRTRCYPASQPAIHICRLRNFLEVLESLAA
ncbi:hypothetical protein DXG01_008468 [Tephrocybe rancida]|nr:hypothetical protein DXG01_008468 [Tephrocybe rancida]